MGNNLAAIMTAGATQGGARDAWRTVDSDGVAVETFVSKDGTRTIQRASMIRALTTPTAAAEGVVIGMLAAAGIDPSPEVIADAALALATVAADALRDAEPGVTGISAATVYVRRTTGTDKDGEPFERVTFEHARRSGKALPLARVTGEALADALASILAYAVA